jgi:hypothetical protein
MVAALAGCLVALALLLLLRHRARTCTPCGTSAFLSVVAMGVLAPDPLPGEAGVAC